VLAAKNEEINELSAAFAKTEKQYAWIPSIKVLPCCRMWWI
jgi:hypothetical protein